METAAGTRTGNYNCPPPLPPPPGYHLVLSSSGARFPCFVGALQHLEKHVFPGLLANTLTIVGTSGGAFIGLLIALGYTLRAMDELCMSLRYDDVKNFDIKNFLHEFGLDNGSKVVRLLQCIVIKKLGNTDATFADLFKLTGRHLIVTGTNVTKGTLVAFDHVSYPDLPLWRAVRISMSMPFLFTSEQLDGDFYVDGAILDSFPMSYLPPVPVDQTVVGINLEYLSTTRDILDVVSYMSAITMTMLRSINKVDYDALRAVPNFEAIRIQTPCMNQFDLDVTVETRASLRDSARRQVAEYFETAPHRLVHAIVRQIMNRVVARNPN